MTTDRETVRTLCKSIITRLENRKAIAFPPRLRQVVTDEVFGLVGPYILTDQDIRERAISKMGASTDSLTDSAFTESEQFKVAKSVVRKTFGDDELNGFYFQRPVKTVAESIAGYFMRSSHIDDVFESDEDIEKQIVDTVKTFSPKDLH